jgi:AmiR/NasT family two-component response regulator
VGRPCPSGECAVHGARALAAHATLAGQLQTAFTTRLIIEQAKGILTERHRIDGNQAFDLMRRYARHHQLKLTDLAHDITTGSRALPDDPRQLPESRAPRAENPISA